MTDVQLTILVAAIASFGTALGAVLKWAVERITKALDRNTDAMLAHVASNATLVVKIDGIAGWVEDHTPPLGSPLIPPSPRRRTPQGGVQAGSYGPRPGTHTDEDR